MYRREDSIFYKIRRKIKRRKISKWSKKTGKVFHHHVGEIVLSEQELLNQLEDNEKQDYLLKLFIYGKDHPDYKENLLRVCLKFDFLGSMVFPIDEESTDKPSVKLYIRNLFEGYYETIEEVKDHVERIKGEPVSYEFAKMIFHKMVFVINTCCPLMADMFEIWHAGLYRGFIEYAVENDEFEFADEDNIWKLFPGNKFEDRLVLDGLSVLMLIGIFKKLITEAWEDDLYRW